MFCVACGKEVVETAKFCTSCGAEVVAAAPLADPVVEAPAPVPVRPFPMVPALVAAALLLVAGGAAWWSGAFGGTAQDPAASASEAIVDPASAEAAASEVPLAAASATAEAPAATGLGQIVGTWELVAEQCCGSTVGSDELPWEPVAAGGRERVTFYKDGRFTSNSSNNPGGKWSISNGSIEGWYIYLVDAQIKGDTMIVIHMPTSSQNAYSNKWRRVGGTAAVASAGQTSAGPEAEQSEAAVAMDDNGAVCQIVRTDENGTNGVGESVPLSRKRSLETQIPGLKRRSPGAEFDVMCEGGE